LPNPAARSQAFAHESFIISLQKIDWRDPPRLCNFEP
jgi:hypothetical protein